MDKPKPVEYRLGSEQRTTVLALAAQRQRVVDAANREVAALNAALNDLARRYADDFSAVGQASFEQKADGQVVLVVKPIDGEPEGGAQ